MGAFENLMSGVAGTSSEGREEVSKASGPRDLDATLPTWAKKAMTRGLSDARGSDRSVLKQDVDRRARLPQALRDELEDTNAAPKPYDPELLRDLSGSPVPQTYIDTLAQDAAAANWNLVPKDEDADVDPDEVAQAERKLRDLVPDMTFGEFLEEWSRNTLRLGDGTVVKHYPGGNPENPVGEIVHVDSATMFKKLDDHGFTDGYVQYTASSSNRGGESEFEGTEFDMEEVVWTSWARRGNHVYGEGPVEKGQDTIEILEEILEKELLDLVQGMPPGVISRPPEEEFPTDPADWENFKEDMQLMEGERHRLGFTKFPVEYTPLSPNYQEMQLLDRYTSKVTELGGVFKVNPSYAGFDFENTNRATDESQQEAYKQRGFQVLITRLEEAITMGILPDLDLDLGTELRFTFERERTVSERQSKANALQDSIQAGKEAADAGLDVTWRDGMPVIEDGEMEAGNVGGGGDGGGLFASLTPPDRDELAKGDPMINGHDLDPETGMGTCSSTGETITAETMGDLKGECPYCGDPLSVFAVEDSESDTKNRHRGDGNSSSLSVEEAEKLDELLYRTHEEQIFPESADSIEKVAFEEGDLPDYVREKIEEALADGSVFEGIDAISDELERARDLIEDILEENLLDGSGWKLSDIRDDIQSTFPNVDREEAETIARTETASTLNTAREKGYEERDDAATIRFKWVGPDDSRTTDACEFMKQGSSAVDEAPFSFAGTEEQPLPMDELKRVEREAAGFYFSNLSYREHVLHPNERHTFRRVLPSEQDGMTAAPG